MSYNPNDLVELYRELSYDRYGKTYIFQLFMNPNSKKDFEIELHEIKKNKKGVYYKLFNLAGGSLLYKENNSTFSVTYDIYDSYLNCGLGQKLVDFSKRAARKLGAKYLLLNKIERTIVNNCEPKFEYDGNLKLYLSNGFHLTNKERHKLDKKPTDANKFSEMICDLTLENQNSNLKYCKQILKSKTECYIDRNFR